ncbi:MAG: polysaccharide deacetylase family protein [Gemmatimonadaceae bacterium]
MPSRRSAPSFLLASLVASLVAAFAGACAGTDGNAATATDVSTGDAGASGATATVGRDDDPAAMTTAGGRPAMAVDSDEGATTTAPAAAGREPNELGRIMVIEYHLIGDTNSKYERERGQFRRDLQLLHDRGFRPVTMQDVMDRKVDLLPRGISPVVVTFDDASPSQFRYIEKDGKLEIDPTSGLGIWLDFARANPEWKNRAVFCMLPGAAAGRSFFGDKGIEGQKSEWRHQKVRFLHEQGFELCNHTLWHANLGKYGDAMVQEQIARGVMAIDSAVPGYKVRTFALPLGVWPKNRALAYRGSWTDPKSGRTISYAFDAVLEVAGGPTRGPNDPAYKVPGNFNRIEVIGDVIERTIDQLERAGQRYVSDGDPDRVARPATTAAAAAVIAPAPR